MRARKHQKDKQRGQDSCSKVHEPRHVLFDAHTLCMNYVTTVFLLVSCSDRSQHMLCFASSGGAGLAHW